MKKFSAIVINLALSLILAVAMSSFFGIGSLGLLLITAIVFATSFIPRGAGGAVAYAGSLDLSNLDSKLKDYALANTDQILTQTLVDDTGFENYMFMIPDVIDEIPLTQLVMGDILQPGGKDAFNPTNNALQFKDRLGKVRPCKVDLQFPNSQVISIYKSYLGQVKGKQINPYELPFEAFFMQQIAKKAKDNLRRKAIFKGVYNAAGTAPADTMDGLLTIVTNAIAATTIPAGNIYTAGGAFTASNAVDQIEAIADIVDPLYDGDDFICLLSPTVMKYYKRDYRASFTAAPYNKDYEKQYIDGTSIELIPEIGMAGSNRVIITRRQNAFWLTGDTSAVESIIVERQLRNINVLMDFEAAPEIGIAEIVYTNDYAGIS
jgi:hypothetical protein